ncbi:MAG: hypothetical protein HS103_08050 [Anaerolineales bacterium]|nr:hypothetical protein [Anaerolineales bacterium]
MVDSPAYHDMLIDGLGGGDLRGKRATPALLVRRLVAAQPVRVLYATRFSSICNPSFPPSPSERRGVD